jgi:hypothetical protein
MKAFEIVALTLAALGGAIIIGGWVKGLAATPKLPIKP